MCSKTLQFFYRSDTAVPMNKIRYVFYMLVGFFQCFFCMGGFLMLLLYTDFLIFIAHNDFLMFVLCVDSLMFISLPVRDSLYKNCY